MVVQVVPDQCEQAEKATDCTNLPEGSCDAMLRGGSEGSRERKEWEAARSDLECSCLVMRQ
eukprot:9748974-Alexandrium_andersonii.AAC.1